MNRRGFIGLFAAVIAVPIAVISGRNKVLKSNPEIVPVNATVRDPRQPATAVDLLASAPEAYGVTRDNFRQQLTPIKDIMRFTNHGEINT